jgi:hypothetical protein
MAEEKVQKRLQTDAAETGICKEKASFLRLERSINALKCFHVLYFTPRVLPLAKEQLAPQKDATVQVHCSLLYKYGSCRFSGPGEPCSENSDAQHVHAHARWR